MTRSNQAWQRPNFVEVKMDAETAAAIERGIRAADEGKVVSNDEVRKLIPQWISKFSTPSRRCPGGLV